MKNIIFSNQKSFYRISKFVVGAATVVGTVVACIEYFQSPSKTPEEKKSDVASPVQFSGNVTENGNIYQQQSFGNYSPNVVTITQDGADQKSKNDTKIEPVRK